MAFRVSPEDHPDRWCRHSLAMRGITTAMILDWANTKQMVLPPEPRTQLLSRGELAYLTRRLALGDHVHVSLQIIGRPSGVALRTICYKIQDALADHEIIIRGTSRKIPILNAKLLAAILDGRIIPPVLKVGANGKARTVTREHLYYMVYLRQIKNLSRLQMQRVTNCPTVDILLGRYGLWDNPDAHARSYATGQRKQHKPPLQASWVHPSKLVTPEVLDRKIYTLRIRHYTNLMVAKYGHLIRNAKFLNTAGYVVDHAMSIRDGFEYAGKQTPWQMLCHPANLQVLTIFDNASKAGNSYFNPQGLERAINEFNKTHGTVLIPIDTKTLESLSLKYRAIANNRRSA